MAMSTFQSAKHEIVNFLSISKDALHIHVGLAVFLLTAALARKGLRSVAPLVAVFVVALAGELLDARDDFRRLGYWRFMASLSDFINTVCWPTALWLLARYSRVMN
jgi:hypothetical protein